jgi:hypothetical protein
MGRNTDAGKVPEKRVHVRGQAPRKQPVYPGSAEFTRRQTDPVHDNELGEYAGRTGVEMRRQYLPYTGHQACRRLDFQWRLHTGAIMPQSWT